LATDRPQLTPVSRGPRAPWQLRGVAVGVIAVVIAFAAGMAVAQPPPRQPVPSPTPVATTSLAPQGSPSPTATEFIESTPLPLGIYHVTPEEAAHLGAVKAFYDAYNAGSLEPALALLSATARILDCDYAHRTQATYSGRDGLTASLRARFADHDLWKVEFYQEAPENVNSIVIFPLERRNDTLRRLGAPDGVKKSFPLLFVLTVGANGLMDYIQWGSTMGDASVAEACSV